MQLGLALTLGNAVLATSLLITDLLDRKIPEKKIVTSIGLMCLISSPLGGFPMYNRAGGLAAQYRFGARTGGSNIISGRILLLIAFFLGSQELVNIIPYGVLESLFLFSALQLFKNAIQTKNKIYTALTGIIALYWRMTVAFTTMFIIHIIMEYLLDNYNHININN